MDEKDHSIRFINSNYDTLFRIPDGGIVEVRFPDRAFSAKCEYLDDYHTMVGDTVFHICEFAEMVERQGGSVRPEPKTTLDKAAWQLAHREYLIVERTDSGFRYELLTKQFASTVQGQVDRPGWSMNQAREYILDTLNMTRRNRRAVPFEEVKASAKEAAASVLGQLNDLKNRPEPPAKAGRRKPMAEKTQGKYPSQFEKVKEITDKLEAGIKELMDSDKFKEYLKCLSKFHNYSLGNTILIALQKPDATLVAGYTAWKNQFGRQVQKGEQGIRILAPTPYKRKMEVDVIDPSTGQARMNPDGTKATELKEIMVPAFKVVNVFDVSQTDGRPIPSIGVNELTGDVRQYEMFFEALKRSCPVPIAFEQIDSGAKGYYHTVDHRIALQEGMSQVQTIKTLIHEMTHQHLHSKDPKEMSPEEPRLTRNAKEVEAESVAYTVAQHYGIETSDYSFAYIAGWSAGKDTPELKASLDRIRTAADELITGIDTQLQILQKEKMAELETQAETLAVKLDELSYDFDYYGYVDAVDDREAVAQQNKEMLLENGTQVEGILEFLQEVVDDDGDCSARAAALITEVKEFSEAAAAFLPPKGPDQPVPGLQENGTYRYYSTQRPVDLGTFPKPPDNPVVEVHNYDADSRIPVENGMIQAWGYVEYKKPLTEKEAGDYELRPAPARFTEKEVRDMQKPDIQAGKADIHLAKPDIGLQTETGGKPEPEKKSVLKDLEAKTPKPREPKASRKPKKQKEETR